MEKKKTLKICLVTCIPLSIDTIDTMLRDILGKKGEPALLFETSIQFSRAYSTLSI